MCVCELTFWVHERTCYCQMRTSSYQSPLKTYQLKKNHFFHSYDKRVSLIHEHFLNLDDTHSKSQMHYFKLCGIKMVCTSEIVFAIRANLELFLSRSLARIKTISSVNKYRGIDRKTTKRKLMDQLENMLYGDFEIPYAYAPDVVVQLWFLISRAHSVKNRLWMVMWNFQPNHV